MALGMRKTLAPGVVRAVKKSHVVAGFGAQLRAGSAGTQETFDLSHPCEELDVFLSHSW